MRFISKGVAMFKDDPKRAVDALYCIPANLPRPQWVKVAFAFHAAGGRFDDFDKWSAQDEGYNVPKTKATWKSSKAGGGITEKSLFFIAREHGYKESSQGRPQVSPQVDFSALIEKKPAAPQPQKALTFDPALNPALIWERCIPATPGHAYIVQKQSVEAPLGGLRVVPEGDPLRQMGESMAGSLVVPVMRPDGFISSLQFITVGEVAKRLKANEKPTKLNLRGASMEGWFTVGEMCPGGMVYVCEGIGTAWAAWKATGSAAVVCFGAGNMERVASALRQQDSAARLVVCPDVGQEDKAISIAAAVGGAVAAMPEGWPKNSDLNDLGQSEGFDVVAWVLQNAQEPPRPETTPHPLAVFVELDGQTKPPRWVIPGFVEHNVLVISGSAGVGKTTAILPLALTAAGLHGGELMPIHWRHVVYITEDVEQAKRILAGIVNHGDLGIDWSDVRERLHMVPAKRLKPEVVASVGTTYREMFTRTVQSVEILPLVVLDTKSAVLDVEDENSNSEASKMMAALKQGFNDLPIWLIGHVAKTLDGATEGLTARGAGSIGGDATQTMFLIKDKQDKRYLQNDKKRFEQKWPQIDLISNTKTIPAVDEFGNLEEVTLRWAIAKPGEVPNKELAEQIKAERSEQEEKLLLETTRHGLLNKAAEGWILGNPHNKTGLKNAVAVKAAFALKVMEKLFHERWLHEIDVPRGERVVNSKASYVIALTTPEHDALLAGEDVLQKYRVIPSSWKKALIPLVPGVLENCPRSGSNPPESGGMAQP
jgi:hypothetical protein